MPTSHNNKNDFTTESTEGQQTSTPIRNDENDIGVFRRIHMLIEEGNRQRLNINVRILTRKTIHIIGYQYSTIYDLKSKVEEKEGISVDQQRFIYAGKQLEDDRTVKDYDIRDQSVISLVLRLTGTS